jgi:DNA mismatch repair protein MutS2
MGAAACHHISPWVSRWESEELRTQTQEAIALDSRLPGGVPMLGIYDLQPHLLRAERGGMLTGLSLGQIASTLAATRKLRRSIDDSEGLPQLQDLVDTIRTYPDLERDINRCVDERGEISDRASETLATLRMQVRGLRDRLQTALQQLMSKHSTAVQEPVLTERNGRFVIPLKASHRDVIRGLVHDSSASGATLYVEPHSVVEDNNHLRQLQGRERREEERILTELSRAVGAVGDDLRHLQAVVVQVDRAIARGRYSLWLNGHPANFAATSLSLRQVRHPLLLWQDRDQSGTKLAGTQFARTQSAETSAVIPIDLVVSPEHRVVVITGPNTGGKTVALKTLGLMVLMAKAGIFLPAREPVDLPWFDGIFADIGDEQSLQQSLSTFSGHIRRISRILARVDSQALVLLDEVGAGTDPTEGSALAAALLEHLSQTARLTVASTHYGELKTLKYQYPYFENASVEFDAESLAPTYRLLWGIPGRSHALAIASRLGLDPQVVEGAKGRLEGESFQVDTAIAGLEGQRSQQEEKLTHLNTLQQELEALQRQMEQRAQQLQAREAALVDRKARAIEESIRSARGEVAAVIRRLQQGPATAQDAQIATAELDRLSQVWRPPPPAVETEFYPAIGDRVRLRGLNQTGEVIGVDGNEFTVRSGILRFTVDRMQLEPLDEQQAKHRQRPKVVKPAPSPTPTAAQIRTRSNTLDLRGQKVAEAERLLEDWIANATAGPLWIVHGHGTGKLKAGIREFLQSHPRVLSLTDAASDEGGTGATVVQVS